MSISHLLNSPSSSAARLCERCQVLNYDEENGYARIARDGTPFLAFGADADNESSPGAYNVWLEAVHFEDDLPHLPRLRRSSEEGCEFCRLLRVKITEASFDYHGTVDIDMGYIGRHYKYPDTGLSVFYVQLHGPNWAFMDGVFMLFTVESNDDRVASWLRLPRFRQEQVLCDENVEFMRNALECCSGVDGCHPFVDDGFLPTRLLDLDVGSNTKKLDARLVETADRTFGHPIKYAALSYCWGSVADASKQLKTTMDNLQQMKRLIPEESMTQTMKDAIRVCRALSIQYLWIDALCIIQDNQQDWQSESMSMALVYKHALVTFAALSSNSCHESFLDRDRKYVEIEFHSKIKPEVHGTFNVVATDYSPFHSPTFDGWPSLDVRASKLGTRGWTLQEWVASERRLLFGKSMIHFCCAPIVKSENGMSTKSETDHHFSEIIEHHKRHPDVDDRSELYGLWWKMLEDYGCRQFTEPEDRLPALSGMARIFAEITGDQYLAGLWKANLATDLLWTAEHSAAAQGAPEGLPGLIQRLSTPTLYIAPSWSTLRQACISPFRRIALVPTLRAEYILIEGHTAVQGSNRFGAIQSGHLRLQSKFMRLSESNTLNVIPRWTILTSWYIEEQGKPFAYFYLDWSPGTTTRTPTKDFPGFHMQVTSSSDPQPSRSLGAGSFTKMSWVRREIARRRRADGSSSGAGDAGHRDLYGLLLCPAQEDGKYLRVGVWASQAVDGYGSRYFDQVDTQEVVII